MSTFVSVVSPDFRPALPLVPAPRAVVPGSAPRYAQGTGCSGVFWSLGLAAGLWHSHRRRASTARQAMPTSFRLENNNIVLDVPGGSNVGFEVQKGRGPQYIMVFAKRHRVYFVAFSLEMQSQEKEGKKGPRASAQAPKSVLRYGACIFRSALLDSGADVMALTTLSADHVQTATERFRERAIEVPYTLPAFPEGIENADQFLSSVHFQKVLIDKFIQHGAYDVRKKSKSSGGKKKKDRRRRKAPGSDDGSDSESEHDAAESSTWVVNREPRWYLHKAEAPTSSCTVSDIFDLVQDYLEDNPKIQIHLGVDSKLYGKEAIFVCVVVLYTPGRGGRVLSRRTIRNYDHKPNTIDRLWQEVADAMEVAEDLAKICTPCGVPRSNIHVHLDLNSSPKHVSHEVYNPGIKWVKSLGFIPQGKPGAWAASSVANRLTNQACLYVNLC